MVHITKRGDYYIVKKGRRELSSHLSLKSALDVASANTRVQIKRSLRKQGKL